MRFSLRATFKILIEAYVNWKLPHTQIDTRPQKRKKIPGCYSANWQRKAKKIKINKSPLMDDRDNQQRHVIVTWSLGWARAARSTLVSHIFLFLLGFRCVLKALGGLQGTSKHESRRTTASRRGETTGVLVFNCWHSGSAYPVATHPFTPRTTAQLWCGYHSL